MPLSLPEIQALRAFVLRAGDGNRPIKGEETSTHTACLQALSREESALRRPRAAPSAPAEDAPEDKKPAEGTQDA